MATTHFVTLLYPSCHMPGKVILGQASIDQASLGQASIDEASLGPADVQEVFDHPGEAGAVPVGPGGHYNDEEGV